MENNRVKPNGMMVASPIINLIVTLITGATGEYPPGLVYVFAFFVILSFIGLVMLAAKDSKAGLVLMAIGCLAFVPIGLIGAMGLRKYKEERDRAKLKVTLGKETPNEVI